MEKILIVEDDDNLRLGISEILKTEGYEIAESSNGMEALTKIENEFPDLILSDIIMPGIDGYALLEKFRNNPIFTNIPFIFLSAKISPEDIRKGMGQGADDYITKPFNYRELLISIKSRLDRKRRCSDMINELALNISYSLPHELRTPLVSIIGFSEILLEDFAAIGYDEVKEMLLNVKCSGKRLLNTIEKFLCYSELNLISREEIKLRELTGEVTHNSKAVILNIAKAKSESIGRQNDLIINVQDNSIRIYEKHLGFMIEELLDNAFKFSEPGSPVEISARIEANRFYIIGVKDYGKGISKEIVSNLFPFKKEEKGILQQGGNGLGLSIVKKISEIYSGELIIQSEIGSFTNIVIKLSAN